MSESSTTRSDQMLEDPGVRAVASLYAQSYLNAAAKVDIENPADELNSFVDDVLVANPELESTLLSGMLSKDRVLEFLERSVIPHCSEFFANFLKVVARRDRFELMPAIRGVVNEHLQAQAGKRQVEVRSAKALTDDAKRNVAEQLQNKLGFEPILNEEIDESLIGGLIIQVGDTVYDSSLRTRLKTLTGRLTERTFNEIQSGRDRFSHPEGD